MDFKNKLFAILIICCMIVSVSAVCAANGESGTAGSNYYDNMMGFSLNGIFGNNGNNTNATNMTNMTNGTVNGTNVNGVLASNQANVGHAAGEPVNKTVNNTANITGNATKLKAAGEPVNNTTKNATPHKAAGEPVNNATGNATPHKVAGSNDNVTHKNASAKTNVVPATGNPIFILFIVLAVLGGVGIIKKR